VDVRDRLGEINVPTLVIRGRHDMSTDPISATLVEGIKGAHEVVLENSSHTRSSRKQTSTSQQSANSCKRQKRINREAAGFARRVKMVGQR
jgi:hypothetical protein